MYAYLGDYIWKAAGSRENKSRCQFQVSSQNVLGFEVSGK